MSTARIDDVWKGLKFISKVGALDEGTVRAVLPVLEDELKAREIRRTGYLLRRSGIKRVKRLEDFDWTFNPKVPRTRVMALADTRWENEAKNAVLIGPSGVGKTHLAESLCVRAIERGVSATSITCYDLVDKLRHARNRSTMVNYYSTVKLLCLDELGYVFPSPEHANDIFQIISRRSELVSTIVTTNLLPAHWGKVFEASTATAILDRLSLNGDFIAWEGRSYRSKK